MEVVKEEQKWYAFGLERIDQTVLNDKQIRMIGVRMRFPVSADLVDSILMARGKQKKVLIEIDESTDWLTVQKDAIRYAISMKIPISLRPDQSSGLSEKYLSNLADATDVVLGHGKTIGTNIDVFFPVTQIIANMTRDAMGMIRIEWNKTDTYMRTVFGEHPDPRALDKMEEVVKSRVLEWIGGQECWVEFCREANRNIGEKTVQKTVSGLAGTRAN